MRSPTVQLAHYVSQFDPQTLPAETICAAKAAVLDRIGVAQAAFREPAGPSWKCRTKGT